ncbi:hypothetical protein KP79_PYT26368 [Mizuhopecten yessoensis]|uniref:Uncharacterized protein n=2 Tax=Mizuhopecten yessoensis TaxID=6573 RepID=A0A210Q6N3_MIZYE|nr:hypothetical protein KP79_PYT26368 [Mizuhopecten yessoensis]
MEMYPFLIVFLYLLESVASENLIQTINDTIGAENYTYYRVSGVGRLRLELTSMYGDADLYVSHITLSPTFNEYELKSTTCGMDVVEIPAFLTRPIGVAVYGYPVKRNETEYSLSVYFVSKYDDSDYSSLDSMYTLRDSDSKNDVNAGQATPNGQQSYQDKEEEEISVSETLWTILLTILKVVFEVLL